MTVQEPEHGPRTIDLDALEVRLELTIPGEIAAIGPAVEQILEAISDLACAREKEHEVEVALFEALANAVRHGCHEDPESRVQITVACEPDQGLLIIIRDPGPGFDPASLPSPVTADNLMRSHGRGIFLINQLMDEVRFERGGTELWMRKR